MVSYRQGNMCPLKDQVETKLDPCQVVRPGDMWCPGEVCKVHRGGDLHRDTSSLLHLPVVVVEAEVAGIVQEAGTYECYSSWWRICQKKIACGYGECDRLIPPSFSLSFPPVWRLPRWLNEKRFACVAARPVTSPRPLHLSLAPPPPCPSFRFHAKVSVLWKFCEFAEPYLS